MMSMADGGGSAAGQQVHIKSLETIFYLNYRRTLL